ncbi:PREDICTED: uncharacterized protein LOC105976823 [Erythranthe guttata]|uniref:uncharacterized protein LOC105976823 n=1 Tax=Erythranthe guttata TaxID=4155 RepID=UPI00064D8E09|nr:PREDICTED: uncharacterized protein LOC105976823 [Erythranthe guttata]|eukprot:XP_012857536.1 PREDICTED: uncharacterized protein LOC105976823 [Erythranthe guttata]
MELIDNTFWPCDRVRIYSIPIGARTVPDMWVWHHTKNGKFSVKSCYHIAFKSRLSDHSTSGYAGAQSGSTQHKWKFIWELNLPPKIRHFIGRASSDIIPTRAVPCGKLLLTHNAFDVGIWWNQRSMFFKLVGALRDYGNLFLLALTIAWRLWGIRNDILHGNDGTSIDDVLSWSQMYLNEFHAARILARNTHTPSLPDAWRGWLKINVDAALPPGQQFFIATRQVHGRPNAEECEAFAALFALQYAKLQGWRSIVVEGDCLTVINALKANVASSAPIGVFVADCFSLISSFDSCDFSFVRRSGNSLAHCLATRFDLSCTEGSSLPSNLANYA